MSWPSHMCGHGHVARVGWANTQPPRCGHALDLSALLCPVPSLVRLSLHPSIRRCDPSCLRLPSLPFPSLLAHPSLCVALLHSLGHVPSIPLCTHSGGKRRIKGHREGGRAGTPFFLYILPICPPSFTFLFSFFFSSPTPSPTFTHPNPILTVIAATTTHIHTYTHTHPWLPLAHLPSQRS